MNLNPQHCIQEYEHKYLYPDNKYFYIYFFHFSEKGLKKVK